MNTMTKKKILINHGFLRRGVNERCEDKRDFRCFLHDSRQFLSSTTSNLI